MKKILLTIFAVLLCFAMVGCDGGWKSTVTDYSGEVSSNGGFLVEKGDYVYYINGIESNSVENKFGSVTKGAIVRTKKADLLKADKQTEMVVPEVCYSGVMDNENGLFIFGDYIYYSTPCSERNKEGIVRNSEVEFMKTKLDGTDSKVIATVASNTTPFRFTEIDGKVYLTVYTTNDDNANVLKIYSAESCELVKETKVVTSYAWATDLTNSYAYYTTTIHNESLDKDESFNALYRVKLDGSEEVEILNGAGTYSDSTNGIGIAGVSFGIVKYTGAELYLTETLVETSSVAVYKGVKTADLTTQASGETPATKLNYAKLVTLDDGSSFASSIFATNSIYVNLNSIVYFDSTYGIVKYDYAKANEVSFGREILFYDQDLISYTFCFIKEGVAYFKDSNSVYYSLNLSEIIDLSTGETKQASPAVKKLNYFKVATSWYAPEFVGNVMVCAVEEEPYYGYVYAIDLTLTDGKTEEELDKFAEDVATLDREHILARNSALCGIMSEADKESFNTFMSEKYPEKEETSSSSSASNG